MYNGTDKIPSTHEFKHEKPFYRDGMTYDEYFIESVCFSESIVKKIKYKSVEQQLIDGDIHVIPDKYKISCPFPEKCTAYADLIKTASKTA